MLNRIFISLAIVVVVIAVPILTLGYQIYNSGDTYGDQLQIADPQSLRSTQQGDVIGFLDNTDSHTWMGIPYAKAPIGALRWKAPIEAKAWQGTLNTLQAANKCKQIGSFGESRPGSELGKPIGHENCLFLNVFAPKFSRQQVPSGSERLPVMVYIHGGGNTAGYANQFKYSGRNLAKNHNVIVVNFNYRLGLFGWFAHASLNKEGTPEDQSGNYGNLDSLAVLRWVHDNIESFGGNPDNVTLFGESAGGMNVFALLASPLAQGLFHKAIVQSGLPVSIPMAGARNYIEDGGHDFSAREVVNKLMIADGTVALRTQAIGRQDGMSDAEVSGYLRSKSADEILDVYATGSMATVPMIFRDGEVLPEASLMQVYSDTKNYNAMPIIVGTNRDEFKAVFIGDRELVTLDMGFLPRIIDEPHFNAVTGYFNDSWKAKGVDEVAIRLQASQAAPVFAYRFDWDELPTILGVDLAKLVGALHASEVPFVFGSFDDRFMNDVFFSDENIPSRNALSEKMSSYWAEFAYTGSPGRGRDGTLNDWQAWNEQPGAGKYVMLDGEKDGGVRMNNLPVTFDVLKIRLLADTSFPSQMAKSKMYDCIFKESEQWDEREFKSLGGKTCDIPIFDFLRL